MTRIGPPSGTDLWQSNDQLTNKVFRRTMRRLLTDHGIRYKDNLQQNAKIPRPTNGQFVKMIAKAVETVNKTYSTRTLIDGEVIKTGVVERSFELAG